MLLTEFKLYGKHTHMIFARSSKIVKNCSFRRRGNGHMFPEMSHAEKEEEYEI